MKPLPRLHAAAVAAALVAVLAAVPATPAQAGRSCETVPPLAVNVTRALDLAQRTAERLEASGAQVVVLARAGQDLSRWGLRWSHLAFAYRDTRAGAEAKAGTQADMAVDARPVWRVVHKLNQCGSAQADLYRQGLGEFFLDDLWDYQAAWAVPSTEVQQHLLPLLQDDVRVAQLHTAAYSLVAYPWAQTYQQSNQWAIETLALAEEPGIVQRDQAQAWLRFKGYRPTTLTIGALTRLGARISAANVAFDDHPNEQRFADRIDTVTVDSVFAWLERSRLAGRVQVMR